jgi:hypothetical protein
VKDADESVAPVVVEPAALERATKSAQSLDPPVRRSSIR